MKPFGVEFLEPLPPDATFGAQTSTPGIPITGPTKIRVACVTLWIFVDTDETIPDWVSEDAA